MNVHSLSLINNLKTSVIMKTRRKRKVINENCNSQRVF